MADATPPSDVDLDDGVAADETVTTPLSDSEFKTDLAAVLPHLRAFGRSLSGNPDIADDLVQEAMLKAWAARASFRAGTNMRAWMFTILRNIYFSQMRRARFKGDWDEDAAGKLLAVPAGQDSQIDLADMHRALQMLPEAQREALILVGAGGFSYEEAAEICDVALGTIKSRVARARTALEAIMDGDEMSARQGEGATSANPLADIMDEVDKRSAGRE